MGGSTHCGSWSFGRAPFYCEARGLSRSPGVPEPGTEGDMATPAEHAAMRRALVAADIPGWRDVNPRVGAVVIDPGGAEIALGSHRGRGTPHAEAVALEFAGAQASGATVVVTLEPCNAGTRKPACTDLLLRAGVTRVVYAVHDPNPRMAGGAQALRAAGVDVEAGLLAAEATRLNEYWLFAMRTGRPFVSWKFATTLDGRSAAPDGTSKWITGEEARGDVQRLRATVDTVLVGTGTVREDDPWLILRDDQGKPLPRSVQPRRAVMGRTPIPPGSRVLDDAAETVVLDTREPGEALSQLRAMGCSHVLLEGGPIVAAGFLRAGLVDRYIAYVAPALLGAGLSTVADLGLNTIDEAVRLELADVTTVGCDVRLTLTRNRPKLEEPA
jgi:diaminohydroxyphosphoribosylaminopyrimidine deaminase / 5-amino-6-(5-phosphoribosylamino)uracil reductase